MSLLKLKIGNKVYLAKYESPKPTVTIGGRKYPIVQIGNLWWMAENLDLDDYGAVNSSNPNYGKLYPFSAISSIPIPSGWRIPTDADGISLCGSNGTSAVKYRVSNWDNGTNITGFSAVPAGYNDNGTLYTDCNMIFTARKDGNILYFIKIDDSTQRNMARVYHGSVASRYKMSIRLVKDAT